MGAIPPHFLFYKKPSYDKLQYVIFLIIMINLQNYINYTGYI